MLKLTHEQKQKINSFWIDKNSHETDNKSKNTYIEMFFMPTLKV